MFRRLILAVATLLLPTILAAQEYKDPITGGPLTWSLNEVIGDGSTPNGGTPPAIANMVTLPVETYDPTPYLYTTTDGFRPVTSQFDQAKVRFTCGPNLFDTIDSWKEPGKPRFSQHGHEQFGIKVWTPNDTYTSFRAFANDPRSAFNTCPGPKINNSGYWGNAIYKKNAMGAGKPALIKKPNLITLYYFLGGGHSWQDFAKFQPLFPGYGEIMGTFMKDPDQTEFYKQATAYKAAHPELLMNFEAKGDGPRFHCENTNGATVDALVPGSAEQPALSNPAKGDRATLACALNETIIRSTASFTCWNGSLPQPGDGQSHMVPSIHMDADGKEHCPNHFWLLPTVETQERYSHMNDIATWDCDVVDAMALAAASAKAGFSLPKRGKCWASHLDYQLGWDVAFLKRWLCRGLGISLLGATNCYPHDLTFNQIDDTTALVQTPGILSNKFTGAKLSDWLIPQPVPGGMHGMMGHGPM